MLWSYLGIAAMAVGGAADAPGSEKPAAPVASASVILKRCVLEFDRSADVGAVQTGVLQECLVKPGDRVKAGQILGRLRDEDVRVELELRTVEAGNDLEIRVSESKQALAQSKLRSAEALSRRSLVSAEEHRTQAVEAEAATLAVEEAKRKKKLAEIQRRQAEAALRAREFTSPIDGVVVAAVKSRGEPVALNEPTFRVVDPERIRVTGQLDVADAWRVQAGHPVRVSPVIPGVDLPLERQVFEGRVEFVELQLNAQEQTCKVVAVVANRDGLLRAGLEAHMEIEPGAGETPAVARKD